MKSLIHYSIIAIGCMSTVFAERAGNMRELSASEADAIIKAKVDARAAERAARRSAVQEARIIKRTVIEKDGKRTIYEHIEQPDLSQTVQLSEAPIMIENRTSTATPEDLKDKAYEMLQLSARVHDNQWSEIRWQHEGQTYHAISRLNFNDLRIISDFEAGDTRYFCVMSIEDVEGSIQAKRLEQWLQQKPERVRSWYTLRTAIPEGVDRKAVLKPIHALHAYYLKNRRQLAVMQQHQEALAAARKRYEAKHPKDEAEVIRFWKVQ